MGKFLAWGIVILGIVIAIGLSCYFDIWVYLNREDESNIFDARMRFITAITSSSFIIAGVILTTIRMRQTDKRLEQTERQLQQSRETFNQQFRQSEASRLDTRFKDAVQLLGSEDRSVRTGGLYVLFEIAKSESKLNREDKDYHSPYPRMVVEIICGFIRTQSNKDFQEYIQQGKQKLKYQNKYLKEYEELFDLLVNPYTGEIKSIDDVESKVDQKSYDNVKADVDNYINAYGIYDDIQTAMNILFLSYQYEKGYQEELKILEKLEDKLNEDEFRIKKFELREKYQANIFYPVDKQQFNLEEAKLQKANLREANLQNTDLRKANLQNAWLIEANLQEANLWSVNLQNATLWEANLQGADLEKTNLQEVYFVTIDLTNALINNAIISVIDDEVILFKEFYWYHKGREYYAKKFNAEEKKGFEQRFKSPIFLDCYMYDDNEQKITNIVKILDTLTPKPEENKDT